MRGCLNRRINEAYTMQYVIGINIVYVRWSHNDRWSAQNLINHKHYLQLPFALSSYQHLLQMSTHYPELKSFMKLDFNDIAALPSFDLTTFVSRYHQPYFPTNCIYGTGLVDTTKDCFQSGKEVLLKMDTSFCNI